MVGVDYDFTHYLPDDAESTKALDIMNEEYNQAIPNMRIMLKDVSVAQALLYKEKIADVNGVQEINWLDDAVNIYEPLEMASKDTLNTWYKNNNALFQLTIDDNNGTQAIHDIRVIIGNDNYMTGNAVTNALAPVSSAEEIQQILLFAVPLVFLVLLLTTNSWFEPVLFMASIGVAALLNMGTNLMFGTISFVTNAAGSVLQLAVSMDYSIFLLHRFSENRNKGLEVNEAMRNAVKQSLGSILSSGLTTVSGFAALVLMQFKIGPDMGWVMAKAIVFSLICVLCLLPSLTMCFYKIIDKTKHRSFIPPFDKFAAVVLKMRIPFLTVFAILIIPSILGQQKNSFLYGGSQVYSTEDTQMGRDMIEINKAYGESETVVLMVPKGEIQKEISMNHDLLHTDKVTSVISYVNSVGSMIPEEFIPKDTISQLYSAHYSRFIVSLDTSEAQSDWTDLVDQIRKVGEKYYGDELLYAGNMVSTEDLKYTSIQDTMTVNFLAVGFVFLILIFNFKSISLPIILTLVIEASICINLCIPYFQGWDLFYIGYLIISSVQLGATIDYGILFTDRYMEYRKRYTKKEAARITLKNCTISILTSALILMLAGMVLGKFSSNGVISQLGTLLGRGAIISFILVIFVLPTLLMLFDRIIEITTKKATFYKEMINNENK